MVVGDDWGVFAYQLLVVVVVVVVGCENVTIATNKFVICLPIPGLS